MMKNRINILFGAIVLSCSLILGCAGNSDVSFARSVMKGLTAGRYSARTHIKWETLTIFEGDVGLAYSTLANDKEKVDYQRAFIENFAKGFKSQGASFGIFYNWRLIDKKDIENLPQDMSIVEASCKNSNYKALFYIVHEKGKRKLTGLRFATVDAAVENN